MLSKPRKHVPILTLACLFYALNCLRHGIRANYYDVKYNGGVWMRQTHEATYTDARMSIARHCKRSPRSDYGRVRARVL